MSGQGVTGVGTMGQNTSHLERLSVTVPDAALPVFEAAFDAHCDAVGFFRDEDTGTWTVEAIRRPGDLAPLETALALAATVAGIDPPVLARTATAAGGWLEKLADSFPPQRIGRGWLVLGTHDAAIREAGRIGLVLDAGLAFGSGEHGSTRGCLRALEGVRSPRGNILDLGTGSGILAIAAARKFRRPVLATDIEPWSVLVAAANARANGVGRLVRVCRENAVGRRIRAGGPYGLVLANILARPLCAMAHDLVPLLRPGAQLVLAGLLASQANQVCAAWRRRGVVLRRRIGEGRWITLVLRAPAGLSRRPSAAGPKAAA